MSKQESVSKVADVVNWEDPALQRWLGTITRPTTRYNYRSCFRAYGDFTGMTGSQLIDEALEDFKRDPREKRDVVLKRLVEFYQWLKTEYPRKSRGRGEHRVIGKGVSDKLAHSRVNAVRSFYATFGVTVRMKGRHALPKARVQNKRMIVAAEQVKVLVDHARSPRDRAIILTHFQSGLDVSTLCNLNYGDVIEGLKKNEHPLKLGLLYRPKTRVEFYTFLGRDAVETLKAYLADMKARGVKFQANTALFLQERGKERMKTNNVQDMMRTVALKAGFIDDGNNGQAQNPLGPHALRESFGSIMINSGVPDTIVDFWLGHAIGEQAEAYKSVQYESLKRMYLEREHLLSVASERFDEHELEQKVTEKVDQRVEALQKIITNYATQNLELRAETSAIEQKNVELKRRIESTEQRLSALERMIAEIRELVG